MPEEADALRAGGTCSYRRPRLQPFQRRPTAAEDSGSYSAPRGNRAQCSQQPVHPSRALLQHSARAANLATGDGSAYRRVQVRRGATSRV